MDIIIDFRPFAGRRLYLENRLEQEDGRGPTGGLLAPGRGNFLLEFRVAGGTAPDDSADPATIPLLRPLPSKTDPPRVTRTFNFDREDGQWAINGRFIPPTCDQVRFRVRQDSVERWVFVNESGDWQHPIHAHLEEYQILSRNGTPPALNSVENTRKDVVRLRFDERIQIFMRFRDFEGRYPLHCHNVLHEDHSMMLRWDVDQTGDTKGNP